MVKIVSSCVEEQLKRRDEKKRKEKAEQGQYNIFIFEAWRSWSRGSEVGSDPLTTLELGLVPHPTRMTGELIRATRGPLSVARFFRSGVSLG